MVTKYWGCLASMNTAQFCEVLVISTTALPSSLKIILVGHQTDNSYSLLETLHWLLSKSPYNFLSLLQGPVMQFEFQLHLTSVPPTMSTCLVFEVGHSQHPVFRFLSIHPSDPCLNVESPHFSFRLETTCSITMDYLEEYLYQH